MTDAVRRFQEILRVPMGGHIGLKTAHAIFEKAPWPEGSYFDLVVGAYYVPGGST